MSKRQKITTKTTGEIIANKTKENQSAKGDNLPSNITLVCENYSPCCRRKHLGKTNYFFPYKGIHTFCFIVQTI